MAQSMLQLNIDKMRILIIGPDKLHMHCVLILSLSMTLGFNLDSCLLLFVIRLLMQ